MMAVGQFLWITGDTEQKIIPSLQIAKLLHAGPTDTPGFKFINPGQIECFQWNSINSKAAEAPKCHLALYGIDLVKPQTH